MGEYKKTALVLGAGGFIGSHMATRLKSEGYWVRGVDIKDPEYSPTSCDEFIIGNLTDADLVRRVIRFEGEQSFDEIYQYAADMGGAGYIFSGENDSEVMYNSATVNLNLLKAQLDLNNEKGVNKTKIFYSSSACMYPELFSERLYAAFNRNHGIPVRVARFHNIYGTDSTWEGGKEKSPAAMCRKVAYCEDGGTIDMWGDGEQTRSFLYIDECIEATRRLMQSEFMGPVNIGSEEMVTINQLVATVAKVAGKTININHIDGPLGVRGRNSNNDLIREKLNWDYGMTLEQGISKTYQWILGEIEKKGE